MNKVTLIGNLGADPEIKRLTNGEVANLRVATNESYTDRTGVKQTQTEWHRISIYVPFLVDRCRGMKKGNRVYIEGSLRTRKYTNKQGNEQEVTEIIIKPYGGTIEGPIVLTGRNDQFEQRQSHQENNRYPEERSHQNNDHTRSYERPSRPRPATPRPHANNSRDSEWSTPEIIDDEIPF